MPWITSDDLIAQIPSQYLLQALDDDGDGEADEGVLDAIVAEAEMWVEGYLQEAGITTPDAQGLHSRIKHSVLMYAKYRVFDRRGIREESQAVYDQWIKPAVAWFEKLAVRRAALTPEQGAGKVPGASIITAPSRTHSATGRDMA
jgi:phage gp36-like protein